ncbi:MAG: putative DNA binding domain-containing protein [Bacteroidales bacterium]|nr:putative DNA binding domain-containing protein [Bacteroidales bacterium]
MKALLSKLLASDTETEVLEFKEAKRQYPKDKLGKYFSALSNEANLKGIANAWLLFGVKNDKNIVGTNISENQLNEYKSEISNHTSPILGFKNTYRVNTDKGTVLMLKIPAAPIGMPVSWKGHYYGRDGESLGALNSEEYERIKRQNIADDWSSKIVKEAGINDLSTEAIAKARKQYTEKNPKLKDTIASWDDSTFLNKAKVCINGKITRTAILLLGNPESEHYINPAQAKITWILKDRDNIEKDYAHFTCPLLMEVENVFAKIRNLKYRYLQAGTLFPDEVDQFDPFIIREAINNCIAHQDYTLGGKINVVEREDGILTFINSGNFIPESVEKVVEADAPETEYRNPFLANAMVNLNMIDTIGSGIKKMFVIQKNKYFPLPDYDFANNKVKVQIIGKVVDENYAKKLAQMDDLSLQDIIMLDKVAKNKLLTKSEIKELRKKKLIEGRKPNFYISSSVAKATGEMENYIRMRGLKDDYYKELILQFIEKNKSANKQEIEKLIIDLLPDILDDKKKKNKVRNIIYAMSKKDNSIINIGSRRHPKWIKV